ncbi:helix-turn-helix transcriptional regulator [Aquirhabdus parva]|uniref:AlpA family phage regulatory protein n=1 Tax=Aquirhabdus parva TaxID=2283318 RepID=A0A345P3Q4_9GAMM|nr:hypothetical protein [Aquirhabdus parva]AXI01913.1 hypothetical protein HYN46_02880 [Aquirhabdus parva]
MTTSVLLSLSTLCTKLDTTPNGIRSISLRDPSFPRAIKMGTTRQARVFYDAAEIDNWLESKKRAREQCFNFHASNLNALLRRQFELKYLQFIQVSNAVSHAGRLLSIGGKQLKPRLRRELMELERYLQLSLSFELI